jgi:hypothetical protein
MRASSTFNELAAPLLYRSIRIDNYSPPLTAPGPMAIENRLSEDTVSNVKHIKTFHYGYHTKEQCFLPSGSNPLEVSILNISPQWDDRYLHPQSDLCPCIFRISPTKLVIGPKIGYHVLDHITEFPRAETIAFVFDLAAGPGQFDDKMCLELFMRASAAKRAVFILWNDPRKAVSDIDSCTRTMWSYFQNRIHRYSCWPYCPKEVLFVNMDSFMTRLKPKDLETMSRRKAASAYASRERQRMLQGGEERFAEFRAAARLVKVNYISMPTYLTHCDWEGVLSEEQAAPWLAGMDQVKLSISGERKRKRSETV